MNGRSKYEDKIPLNMIDIFVVLILLLHYY